MKMNMKKWLCLWLTVPLLLSLTGCGMSPQESEPQLNVREESTGQAAEATEPTGTIQPSTRPVEESFPQATEEMTEPTEPQTAAEGSPQTSLKQAEGTKPAETEPTGPVATEVKETQPAATEPAETQPQQTVPLETQPAETEPPETEPSATEQGTAPVETPTTATEPATEPVMEQIDTSALESYGRSYAAATYGYEGNSNCNPSTNAGYFPGVRMVIKTMEEGYAAVREAVDYQYASDISMGRTIYAEIDGVLQRRNINLYFQPTDDPNTFILWCYYGGEA